MFKKFRTNFAETSSVVNDLIDMQDYRLNILNYYWNLGVDHLTMGCIQFIPLKIL